MDSSWRLLSHPSASGPFNMGADEALLETAISSGTPSLRFYAWSGPWLSVGYAQPLPPDRVQRLEEAGVGFVRRVTGGRAVLHGADLTYSIAAPEGVLPPGVRDSYAVVADALLAALEAVGVSASRSDAGSRAPDASVFDCFERPAADEICVAGRKLSGSAQRRVEGAMLQHGSIRLAPDPPSAVAAVAPGGGLAGTSLEEEGYAISRETLEAACVEAFRALFGASFSASELDPGEISRARNRLGSPSGSRFRDTQTPGFTPESRGKPPQESPSSTR